MKSILYLFPPSNSYVASCVISDKFGDRRQRCPNECGLGLGWEEGGGPKVDAQALFARVERQGIAF